MKTVIVHLPTEEELVLRRLGGKFNRLTITRVADIISRNRTRDAYGCADGTIKLVFSNQ